MFIELPLNHFSVNHIFSFYELTVGDKRKCEVPKTERLMYTGVQRI